jgi:hypothetical protein
VAERNDACFTPLYPDVPNLITDPTCNSFTEDGSGNQGINTDPAFVYCGSRSGKITGQGYFKRDLSGLLKPNTKYRTRAMVYKVSPVKGQNMGNVTFTLAMDSASNPAHYNLIKEAMDSACGYYSRYTPFIENIYVYYSSAYQQPGKLSWFHWFWLKYPLYVGWHRYSRNAHYFVQAPPIVGMR